MGSLGDAFVPKLYGHGDGVCVDKLALTEPAVIGGRGLGSWKERTLTRAAGDALELRLKARCDRSPRVECPACC